MAIPTSTRHTILPAIPPGVTAPELAALLAERRELVSKLRDTVAATKRAEIAIIAGRLADRSALAAALRTNAPDPGPAHEDQALNDQQAAERLRAALIEARTRVDADILKVRQQHGLKWRAKAQARVESARRQAMDALAAYEAARQQLDDLHGWLSWLDDPSARLRPDRLRGVGSTANPATWGSAVTALRRELVEGESAVAAGDEQSNGTAPTPDDNAERAPLAVLAGIDAGDDDDSDD